MKHNIVGTLFNILIVALICAAFIYLPLLCGSITIILLGVATGFVSCKLHDEGVYERFHVMYVITTVIVVLVMLVVTIPVISGFTYHAILLNYNTKAEAEIIDVAVKGSNSYYITVELDNGEKKAVSTRGNFVGMVGDTVEIVYNPYSKEETAYGSAYSCDMSLSELISEPNPYVVSFDD